MRILDFTTDVFQNIFFGRRYNKYLSYLGSTVHGERSSESLSVQYLYSTVLTVGIMYRYNVLGTVLLSTSTVPVGFYTRNVIKERGHRSHSNFGANTLLQVQVQVLVLYLYMHCTVQYTACYQLLYCTAAAFQRVRR